MRRRDAAVRTAAAVGVAVAAAVVALVATWWIASPWDAPVWPLLAFVPVPALVWWLTADGPIGVRIGSSVVVVAVMVGTVAVWASALPGQLRFGGTLDALEGVAVTALADAPASAEACGPPPPLDYGVLGVPTEVCVVTYTLGVATASAGGGSVAATWAGAGVVDTGTAVRQVRFDWRSPPAEQSLVFEGGVAQPPAGRCVRPVGTGWWAWTRPADDCPRGFVRSSG